MPRQQKRPLRKLTPSELEHLERVRRSTTAPAGQVARARALLAVAAGSTYAEAAIEAGHTTGDTVASWVGRFNDEGIAALTPRHGGGPRARYNKEDRESILQELRRAREAGTGGTRAGSLATLRRNLSEQGRTAPSVYTLWTVIREAGWTWDAHTGWRPPKQNRQSITKSFLSESAHTAEEAETTV